MTRLLSATLNVWRQKKLQRNNKIPLDVFREKLWETLIQ